MKGVIKYILVILLLAFSAFEYFFRDTMYLYGLCVISIGYVAITQTKFFFKPYAYILLIILPFVTLVQTAFGSDVTFWGVIGQILILSGAMSLSALLKCDLTRIYVNIIVIIALYSLIIYLVCLNPNIYNYLYYEVATNDSLGVEKAVFSGGGRNFIIYNFQTNIIQKTVGVARNCGPFWEPGMFAVYLIIGLFINIFIAKKNILNISNLILIGALISTFSTGGFIVALLLFVFYILNKGITFFNMAIFIPVAVIIGITVMNLEYVGDKTMSQMENAEIGDDTSRYGALYTQIKMIETSPVIGGEKISDYATSKTLASGTLWPFVVYGIPAGLIFYVSLFIGLVGFCSLNRVSKKVGIELFILIIALSFSQTILLSVFIILLMYSGLMSKRSILCLKHQ